ncbi:hypothetical protein FO519_007687 [Halicephalobus sp. NKZ332]|nr:hypothetical protein FO519_007687 [Halicephalobus sp. NKZ332]
MLRIIIFLTLFSGTLSAPQMDQSEECLKLSKQCEDDTECIHRLAIVQSACVTNTCQPQCRMAAMNLYQNRQGRNLLRSDASCVPGRAELEQCGFLPNKSPKHCNFVKLICEANLQCNSKWEVFISECESETSQGQCSEKCKKHLNSTLSTPQGSDFSTCTCTDKEDQLCVNLRDNVLKACTDNNETSKSPSTPGRSTTPKPRVTVVPGEPDSSSLNSFSFITLILSVLLAHNFAGN